MTGINWFEWGGIRSDSMELLISEKSIYNAPQRDVEMIYVPGRNGDVLIDRGGWKNVDVSYTVQFVGLPEKAPTLRQWLQATGYHILKDSYQPDYFRHGVFISEMNPEEIAQKVGRLQLIFSCKPYLYRAYTDAATQDKITLNVSGSDIINPVGATATHGVATVVNPEAYASQPYIKITAGSGSVSLYIEGGASGRKEYSFRGIDGYIELDSELMCAYKGATLCNDKLLFTGFPVLEPGDTTIQVSSGITKVEIIPRWRRI